MATKLGILQSAYSKIEYDSKVKVDDNLLQKIAEVLGVSVTDIKSATPIIMNFDNCLHHANTQFGSDSIQHISVNEKIIDQLIAQLATKDKQIEEKDKQISMLLGEVKGGKFIIHEKSELINFLSK